MPTLLGIRTRLWAGLGGKPDRIYYAGGGIGDELMLTAVAAAARAAGTPISILAKYPEVWQDNGDPARIETDFELWFYARRRAWIAAEIIHLAYENGQRRHIAEQMAEKAGVRLPTGWRPVLRLKNSGQRDSKLIVIQNSCRGARYAAETKEWPQSRWQELIRHLVPEFHLVQLGTAQDPPLEAVEDRRGRTTLREAAGLLQRAGLFLGLESGLMHVAAAVGTPAVIIYGGRSRPGET